MNSDRKFLIRIKTPNKIFNVKGKQIRSPFEVVIKEKDLDFYKMNISMNSIDGYTIEEIFDRRIQTENFEVLKLKKISVKEIKESMNRKIFDEKFDETIENFIDEVEHEEN